MRFIILFVLTMIAAESRAQLTSNKLFLNKDFKATTLKNEILYRVNQTFINSSPKTWIDSIFNQNKVDSTTLVRVNKYEIAGNDNLLNGLNSRLLNSQSNSQEMGQEKEKVIKYDSPSTIPKLKDDMELYTFVIENLKYPKLALDNEQECVVIVIFVIEVDGSVNILETNNCSYELLINEAKRIINLSSGKWIPSEKNGEPVRVKAKIPITFSLD
jgi:uncharacterized membrane protein YgaE (UPF0421/DUF939 family)